MELLDRMANAYANLSELSQRTEFYSAVIPLSPDGTPAAIPESDNGASTSDERLIRRARLVFSRPNRLLVEEREVSSGSENGDVVQRISDGKTFWTYRSDKNWYTKDPAPRRLRDFLRLRTFAVDSVDLMLMLGIKPFKEMASQVDSIQLGGVEAVRDVPSDTVVIRADSPGMSAEVRLYIGRDDSLLRRMTIESSTVSLHGGRARGNDELDRVADQRLPAQSTLVGGTKPATKSVVRCDSILDGHPAFDAPTFAFTVPSRALLQEPLDPSGRRITQKFHDQLSEIVRRLGGKHPTKPRKISY